jgi:hypothetical protein
VEFLGSLEVDPSKESRFASARIERDRHDNGCNGWKRPCASRGGPDTTPMGTTGTSKLPMTTISPGESAGRTCLCPCFRWPSQGHEPATGLVERRASS